MSYHFDPTAFDQGFNSEFVKRASPFVAPPTQPGMPPLPQQGSEPPLGVMHPINNWNKGKEIFHNLMQANDVYKKTFQPHVSTDANGVQFDTVGLANKEIAKKTGVDPQIENLVPRVQELVPKLETMSKNYDTNFKPYMKAGPDGNEHFDGLGYAGDQIKQKVKPMWDQGMGYVHQGGNWVGDQMNNMHIGGGAGDWVKGHSGELAAGLGAAGIGIPLLWKLFGGGGERRRPESSYYAGSPPPAYYGPQAFEKASGELETGLFKTAPTAPQPQAPQPQAPPIPPQQPGMLMGDPRIQQLLLTNPNAKAYISALLTNQGV